MLLLKKQDVEHSVHTKFKQLSLKNIVLFLRKELVRQIKSSCTNSVTLTRERPQLKSVDMYGKKEEDICKAYEVQNGSLKNSNGL